jgi:hypothetical protein
MFRYTMTVSLLQTPTLQGKRVRAAIHGTLVVANIAPSITSFYTIACAIPKVNPSIKTVLIIGLCSMYHAAMGGVTQNP